MIHQLVSGKNYEMTIKLGETDCLKGEKVAETCEHDHHTGHGMLICRTIVYNQPWGEVKMRFLHPEAPFTCQDVLP